MYPTRLTGFPVKSSAIWYTNMPSVGKSVDVAAEL